MQKVKLCAKYLEAEKEQEELNLQREQREPLPVVTFNMQGSSQRNSDSVWREEEVRRRCLKIQEKEKELMQILPRVKKDYSKGIACFRLVKGVFKEVHDNESGLLMLDLNFGASQEASQEKKQDLKSKKQTELNLSTNISSRNDFYNILQESKKFKSRNLFYCSF